VENFSDYLNSVFNEQEKFIENRFVIKLGSSTVADESNNLRLGLIDKIAYQTSYLIDQGYEIAIVTSGAVACGRSRLSIANSHLVEKQELAAIGSTKLFSAWGSAFENYGKITADHLLSEQDIKAISNAIPKRSLLKEMKSHLFVPVINANDSVNTFELEKLAVSSDNDQLSAFVARLIQAKGLVMLTEANGVWDENKEVIDFIRNDQDLKKVSIKAKTNQGTGGIESKIEVASAFAKSGRSAWITGGQLEDVLLNIAKGDKVGTRVEID
jgi:glutamate 5-kinase